MRTRLRLTRPLLLSMRLPRGGFASTRRLFLLFALASLLLSMPAGASFAHGWVLGMGFCAAMTLGSSWVLGYFRGFTSVGLDVLDALALGALALASADPQTAFALTFASIWYRSLFGSTWRSLLRCGLYVAALAGTIPLWTLIPGHHGAANPNPLLLAFPLMFLTVLTGRMLASGLIVREQNLLRSTVLATAGAGLLGMTDQEQIHALAWAAMSDICQATPRLQLIHAVRTGPQLMVVAATSGLGVVPDTLPGDCPERPQALADVFRAPKNVVWSAVPAGFDGADRWLLVASTAAVPPDAMMSLQTLVTQLTLAFSNSGVRQNLTVRATVDSLTGLANRAHFNSELLATLATPTAKAQVLFIDLDDFKNVNDLLGHQAGDSVLVEVARRLRACSRADDLCARLGGDEFAILLPRASVAEATAIAQRIVDKVAEPIEFEGGGRAARIGASIGIATTGDGEDSAPVIHQADIAMYAAKAQGKGRVQYFNAALLDSRDPRVDFETELANAVATGEIVVHYQPIVSGATGSCTGFEALVRWQHPTQGLLLPADFLTDAEQIGCDVELGAFVLRRACLDGATWQTLDPGTSIAVHVNVSGNQILDHSFFATIVECLAESDLEPRELVIELTESVPLNSAMVLQRVSAMAELGVQILITETGDGRSSLPTLRALPVGAIRLDAPFIDNALANKVDRAAVEAVVHISRQLGLRTIAGRLERAEQHQFARAVGIDAEQGYFHMRPMPIPLATDWLCANLVDRTPVGAIALVARVPA